MNRKRPDKDGGDVPAGDGTRTHAASPAALPLAGDLPRFRLSVIDGPGEGLAWRSGGGGCSVGSHASNDLVLDDPTVSRFHAEILLDRRGARVHDLGSRNGTTLDGTQVVEAFLRSGALLGLGRSVLRFELDEGRVNLPLSERSEFGSVVGTSVAMRTVFAALERAAASDVPILLEGETGTGKEVTAESIHRQSKRKDGPFVVVDCGALPAELVESEVFGHEKGAFTGALARRIGAFEEASAGTIFLDEIGELPPDLQPKLLRVLATRKIRRVGSNAYLPVDVRVIAATNRDLRAEVNEGRFRPDLYFRLAVLHISLPPLRTRPEDIPPLVDRLLRDMGADAEEAAALSSPEVLARLARASWPGNVRELRNYLERSLVMRQPAPIAPATAAPESDDALFGLPFSEARQRVLERFERRYLEALLRASGGRMLDAARAARLDRVYLYKLLRRHGLQRKR